ncbi:MAG: spermidine synthase [Labilithrix sp.]|nr:spermidine synthase [Labilithrix sp.]
MIPWELLGEARTPDGNVMTLTRRGSEYMIMADGKDLMSSRMKGSEEALATIGCERARKREAPVVLVGGLGMGFTLRATLDTLPEDATVIVAELMPVVIEWNRGPLGPLARHPLADKRVRVEQADVADLLRRSPGAFDAILLDVDNGPAAFTQVANANLYDNRGVMMCKAALRPRGVLAVWSAWDDRRFEHRLAHHGFDIETQRVRARLEKGGPKHVIFIGRLP